MNKRVFLPSLAIMLFFAVTLTASNDSEIIFNSASAELKRTMNELKSQPKPPYFLSYSITDIERIRITASFGIIRIEQTDRNRYLDIDIRVGNYEFDNTHIIRGNPFMFSFGSGPTALPVKNDEKAIRSAIWYATDRQYKTAVEKYDKAVTNAAVKIKEEDLSNDFSKEKPEVFIGVQKTLNVDKELWKSNLRKLSAIFAQSDKLYQGNATLQAELITKYFISSEGSKIMHSETYYRVIASASTKAEDGMHLPLHKIYFAYSPEKLPELKQAESDINKMVAQLDALRNAPMMTTFSGPAILSGEAAGVFFHEIFGHRVEGHREKDPNSSQTFKNSIGKKILPEFVDVYFDPTIRELGDYDISGFYKYDDEGVKAQRVVTVKDGLFQNFLMSRSPIENFPNSNGHGRKQPGYEACSRQSNLVVTASKTVPIEELRSLLRDECKKQDKEFGLYFEVVQGGFTFTSRTIPNAFNVLPIVVYKIYADGRPDELVRGVDLIGTPLTTFSNIIAAADDIGIFNGMCGAESGSLPVSANSPSLLVSTIEVQKKQKSQAKLPILSSPLSRRP